MPQDRVLSTELGGILSQIPQFTAAGVGAQKEYNPQLTGLNLNNYYTALYGTPDWSAYAERPEVAAAYKTAVDTNYGYANPLEAAQDYWTNIGSKQLNARLPTSGGAIDLARQSFRTSNPELVEYTAGLSGMMERLNGGATTAGSAARAGYSAASGGPLLSPLQQDASKNLTRVSPIQARLQMQALNLVSNGSMTPGEMAGVQDSVRAAYADRGMLRSNRGVGAEILATDQAARQRMIDNANFATSVDATGQQQLGANRQYALGVQGQGQGLSTFNASQRNTLNQFNAGQRNQQSQFNAGLTLQDRNDQWNRAMGYGQFQMGQAIDPTALASQLQGATPDYTPGMLAYGGDLYNTNYNAASAGEIAKANGKASMTGAAIGGVATIGAGIAIAF